VKNFVQKLFLKYTDMGICVLDHFIVTPCRVRGELKPCKAIKNLVGWSAVGVSKYVMSIRSLCPNMVINERWWQLIWRHRVTKGKCDPTGGNWVLISC